jgi:hypothetical protein
VFHLIYLFGLYWSFLVIDFVLTGGVSGPRKDYSAPVLSKSLIPAVGFLGASLLTVRFEMLLHWSRQAHENNRAELTASGLAGIAQTRMSSK